jgi:phage tail sheath protein FI
MDTSFVAVYFPDIQMLDPQTTQSVFTPPSISAIRVLSRLDAAGSVSAPAGTIRGVIDENAAGWAVQSKVKFDSEQKSTIKTLYDVAINPIISGEGGMGPILFGQRTLLTSADTMLQRISVRRMVLEIRRLVREAAKSFLFQQNKEQVLMTFETTLKPILQQMVNAGGVSAYKITIDTSTTTQVDIESNIVRGRVFLQPTKSDEIIQVDFST